jgi:ParB family chromosome partitioning protein
VQPILVRPVGTDYEIVAGERRWRAAQLAGLRTVPAVVRDLTGSQVMEIALIENLQREDLNPLEEARAYRRLLDEFGMSQDQLAKRLGKSRPQITNTLRLLQLQPPVQELVERGDITMGHAKAVLALEDPEAQVGVARRAAEHKLSVRDTEEAVRQTLQPVGPVPVGGTPAIAALDEVEATDDGARPSPREVRKSASGGGSAAAGRAAAKTATLLAIEAELRARFGTPVAIQPGTLKGSIELTYFGDDDLTRLVDMLLGEDVPRGTSEEEAS